MNDSSNTVNAEVAALTSKAEGGDVAAQYQLGNMYLKGDTVFQDFDEAFKWFSKAADQGDPYAMYAVSQLYYGGHGVRRSCVKGSYWANEAMKHGFNPAGERKKG